MASKPSASELTRMQELTSAWFFRRALKYNKSYKTADEVMGSKEFIAEIIGTNSKPGIYPVITKEWIETFIKQQGRFLAEFAQAKFKEFSVDGGFMDWVSKLVNQKYKINKKDAWDPADVWCIQNENQVEKQIEDAVNNTLNIEVLNSELRTLFEERKVVGISLKKVASKERTARYQEVNIKDGVLFTSGKHPTFDISEIRCDLLMQNSGLIKANDARIFFTVKYTKETLIYTLTIRTSGRTYKPGNLIFEFQEPGAAAQVGKAPVELIKIAAKEHKMNFSNDWKKFPSDAAGFNSEINEWKNKFNSIKSKVNTKITSAEDFSASILTLMVDPENFGTANSKLMQIEFLYNFTKLNQTGMEKFITDLFFLAEKRGKGFGPFGKLY